MDTHDLLFQVLMACGAALAAATCWGLGRIAAYLHTSTKSIALQSFIDRVDDLAERVVKEVWQAYAGPLQAAGKWDASAATLAKLQAMAKLKSYLGEDGLKALGQLIGGAHSPPNTAKTLDDFLGTFVESAIHDIKVQSAAPPVLPSTPAQEDGPAAAAPSR